MLEVKRISDTARLPIKATPHSVGLDIYANLITESGRPNNMLIPPRTTRAVPTGLILKPRTGFAVFVCSRSGMARESSVFVTNAPGVVAPDYRGELMVLLYNGGHESHYVRHHDRVGQIILLPCRPISLEEVDEIDMDTPRGTRGFGSTGR